VHRELQSLRLLCEQYDVELNKINRDVLDELLADLGLSGVKPSTINECKKALRYFLQFVGKEDLAARIKRKEATSNGLTRGDLLSVDEVMKLVKVAMNDRDPALIMCHLI